MAPDLRRFAPLFSVTLAIIVFFLHLFQVPQTQTDWITVALLAVVAVIPYLSKMTTLTVGDFEMELQSQIEEAQEEVERSIPEETDTTDHQRELPIFEELEQLVVTDPSAALLKLEEEIVNVLNRMMPSKDVKSITSDSYVGQRPAYLLDPLVKDAEIPPRIADSIIKVLKLCDQARQKDVEQDEVEKVLRLGFTVLNYLYASYYDNIQPEDEVEIDSETVEQYRHAVYQLDTIIPTKDTPKRTTRYMTQKTLNDFFDGYENHAEFVVRIEKVEDVESPSLEQFG